MWYYHFYKEFEGPEYRKYCKCKNVPAFADVIFDSLICAHCVGMCVFTCPDSAKKASI